MLYEVLVERYAGEDEGFVCMTELWSNVKLSKIGNTWYATDRWGWQGKIIRQFREDADGKLIEVPM